MLYTEIIAVCSQIHTKHINTLCGLNVEFVNAKPGGTNSNHCVHMVIYHRLTAFPTTQAKSPSKVRGERQMILVAYSYIVAAKKKQQCIPRAVALSLLTINNTHCCTTIGGNNKPYMSSCEMQDAAAL
jgi:hypothetical protein